MITCQCCFKKKMGEYKPDSGGDPPYPVDLTYVGQIRIPQGFQDKSLQFRDLLYASLTHFMLLFTKYFVGQSLTDKIFPVKKKFIEGLTEGSFDDNCEFTFLLNFLKVF